MHLAGRLHPTAFDAALDGLPVTGDVEGGVAAAQGALAELRAVDPAARLRWAMGRAMPVALGADPLEVARRLQELL